MRKRHHTYLLLLAGAMSFFPRMNSFADELAVSSATSDNGALRAKEFVVMGYTGILFEMQSGEGSYLKTLTELLRVSADQKAQFLDSLHSLSEKYPNIMDFADEVIKLQKNETLQTNTTTKISIPEGPHVFSGEKLEYALSHLTRGMSLTVILKTGAQYKGHFVEYSSKRIWILGAPVKSIQQSDILAIEAPDL